MENLYLTTKCETLILEHGSFFFLSLLFAYYSKFLFNNAAVEMFFKNLTLTNEQLQELYSARPSISPVDAECEAER